MDKQKVPSIVLVMVLLGLLLPAGSSRANYFSQISGHGTGIDAYTYGGWGTLSISHEETGYFEGFYFDHILVNKTWTNVGIGRMGAGLWGTTIVSPNAPQRQIGPYGTADAWIIDYFTIAAGQSGLKEGDPVQIVFFAELNGAVLLNGYPSGANQTSFMVQLRRGSYILSEMDYTTAGMYPPQNFIVYEKVLKVIDVNIGDRLYIDARLYNWMNGSAHDPGTNETDYLDFASSAITRLGYAPGYESIEIISDANAVIGIPKPDLIVTDVWEQNGVVYYQILNDSIVSCPEDHTTHLKIDGQTVDADTINFPLLPGQRVNRAFANSIWNCTPIDDVITILADATQVIDEADEQNNTYTEIWKCDNAPPVITSGPDIAQLTTDSATISWTTDEDSDSVVKYSNKSGIFDKYQSDGQPTKNHQIVLSNLDSSTTYHFKVESSDESNNTVTSGDVFFKTVTVQSGIDPNVTLLARITDGFPVSFAAEIENLAMAERVEFFIDGSHIETDYSAPFSCLLNPFYLGWLANDLVGDHLVEAVVYQEDDRTDVLATDWSYLDCLEELTDVELRYPDGGHTIYTDTNTAPAEEVDIIVYAVQHPTLAELLSRRSPRGPRGESFHIHDDPVMLDPNELEFLVDDNPVTVTYHGRWMEPWVEDTMLFTFNASGLSLGRHRVLVRTQTENGCYIGDGDSIYVERNQPDVDVTRYVFRNDNRFEIYLRITNNGDSTITLDRIRDMLVGFQGVNKDESQYHVECSYSTIERECAVGIDFSSVSPVSLDTGEFTTVSFTAVPVMYQAGNVHSIGGEIEVEYHDDYESFVDSPDLVSWRDEDGLDIDDSVEEAFRSSDFLIVTNPQALFRLHTVNHVNQLLSKTAEFASLSQRRGVLGYYYAHPSIFTAFEGSALMAVGNLVGDNKDEIITVEIDCYDANDRIRVFNDHREITISGGVLPRFLGTDQVFLSDALAAGDVKPFEGTSLHTRDEIILIDGHSPSGAGRGDVTVYQLLNADNAFDVNTCHVDYEPGQAVAAGNVIDAAGWDGDEILVAQNDGTIDLWGGLAAHHAATSTCYEFGDQLAVGNIIGNYLDEIVILNVDENRVYVYDLSAPGSGADIILDVPASVHRLAVGDVLGGYWKEIIVADYSRDRVEIYNYDGDKDSAPTPVRWYPEDVEMIDDWLYAGDVMTGGTAEVLVAHGMYSGSWHKGTVDILHHSGDWFGYDSRFGLDELINEYGEWAENMAPGWSENGFLMIVGENTIIPTFTSFYSDDPDWWAKLTDNYYASTEGSNPDTPEISVGRIIGDGPLEMKNAIETCIAMAKGDFTLDNSDAYLLAGADINEFEIYSRQIEREILIPKGFDTLLELSFGPTAVNDVDFFEHAKDQDIIHVYGHGGPTGSAGIINTANVISSFDPNSTRPLLSLFWSCDTGMYTRDKSLAEAFIEKGASAYIGATSRSDGGAANPLAREFYSRLGPSSPIGQVLRDAKSNVVNNTDIGRTVRKYNCAVNHLFGDPKMEMEGWPASMSVSATSQLLANQEPPASIQIYLPDYEVTETGGIDHVTIQGGSEVVFKGRPVVPIYTYSAQIPSGYQIQDVKLTQKGGLIEDMGLNIPDFNGSYPVIMPDINGISVEGDGWWPLDEYEWHVVPGPNDSSRLVVTVYPFYYKSATLMSKYYNYYDFDVICINSAIEINRLMTGKSVYQPQESVDVDIYVYNSSGQPQDVIVEGLVKSYDSSLEDGLQLRTLRQVNGLVSYSITWNSDGFDAGDYLVEVIIRNTNGTLLDREEAYFSVGEKLARLVDFKVEPECFTANDQVIISAELQNEGDTNITGSLVTMIQDSDGILVERFSKDFNDLEPGNTVYTQNNWNSQAQRHEYKISVFGLYEGKSTEIRVFPEASAYKNGDFDKNGAINFNDYAFLAQYWLLSFADADIAPAGGDCIVDYKDLSVLCSRWLEVE